MKDGRVFGLDAGMDAVSGALGGELLVVANLRSDVERGMPEGGEAGDPRPREPGVDGGERRTEDGHRVLGSSRRY